MRTFPFIPKTKCHLLFFARISYHKTLKGALSSNDITEAKSAWMVFLFTVETLEIIKPVTWELTRTESLKDIDRFHLINGLIYKFWVEL